MHAWYNKGIDRGYDGQKPVDSSCSLFLYLAYLKGPPLGAIFVWHNPANDTLLRGLA